MSEKDSFEHTMKNLEMIVKNFEKGDLSLEQSLVAYEKGMQLAQKCEKFLDNAQQRVEIMQQQSKSEEQ